MRQSCTIRGRLALQKSCNGINANASNERSFTYNGEAYTLYKLQTTTGTAADQWGFK